jgi:hypothetical protein
MLLCCFQPAFATPTTPTSDFIDNGDGTVTHKLTGLVWMRCSMGQTWDKATSNCTGTATIYTYAQALALKSSFASNNDWRLPNIAELHTIEEREHVPTINTVIFPNTPTNSATLSSSIYDGDSNAVLFVNFNSGETHAGGKYDGYAVRFVRRGSWSFNSLPLTTPTADFTDNKDGTVTHKRTGLIWQRCSAGQIWTGSTCSGAAENYVYGDAMALKSTFAARADWRIPNQNELLSIVEYGDHYPAINTTLFPNTPELCTWSSGPNTHWLEKWQVHFDTGGSYPMASFYECYVRFVRGQWLPAIATYDINTQSAIAVNFGKNYDAKNAKIIELKNTSAKAITVNNVITSNAGSYWVNLFVDSKSACRPLNYTQTLKKFTIPANSSCQISVGFSPFDNLTAGKSIPATITLKTVINGIATDKAINVTGLGRAQIANAYNNKTGSLWGQNTWGMAELKGGNPPINTTLVGAASKYSSAKFWYGGVIDAALQKATANIGNLVVFAQNSASANGHVGVVIQTAPVLTMLSMNDIKDANGVKVRRWSVRPVDWYPSKTATWSPLITGFNATDATKHYGFVDWNSSLY